MQRKKISSSRSKKSRERGVALITTLLLLLLLTAMSVVMVVSVNSDLLINGYYRNFRGSFYAADAGVNIVRADLAQQVLANQVAFSTTTQAFPSTTVANVISAINTKYGSGYAITGSGTGTAASSWPAKFKLKTLSSDPTATSDYFYQESCTVEGGGGTCDAPTGGDNITDYKYVFAYSVTAIGQSQGNEAATISDRGTLTIVAPLVPTGSKKTKFSAWGMFIDQNDICSAPYVPGTITGPVFTNGSWTFGDSGSYIFTDAAGSHGSKAGYQFSVGSNPCEQVAGPSAQYTYSTGSGRNKKTYTATIAPQFQGGLNLNQPAVDMPTDDFDQQEAVLDGKGDGTLTPDHATMNTKLQNINGTAYPTSGASSGVYLPWRTVGGVKTYSGGGIYVEGNANITLTASTVSGQKVQTYTITQGGTTTTITVNNAANTTTMVSGGTTLNLTGVPEDVSTGTANPATMLYVNGSINSLSGPSSGAAVQDGTALTITAANNVTVTGNITYATKPVTTTQNQIPNQIPNAPVDTLIPGNDNGQVLGIYTNHGNIIMKASSNNQNMEVDASLATISNGGTGGLQIAGPNTINVLSILGGRINNQAYTTSYLNQRNVYFDRRFSQNGFGPPWFPSTSISGGGLTGGTPVITFQRVQWVNQTSYK